MADDYGDSTLPLVELFVKVINSEQNIFYACADDCDLFST